MTPQPGKQFEKMNPRTLSLMADDAIGTELTKNAAEHIRTCYAEIDRLHLELGTWENGASVQVAIRDKEIQKRKELEADMQSEIERLQCVLSQRGTGQLERKLEAWRRLAKATDPETMFDDHAELLKLGYAKSREAEYDAARAALKNLGEL